MIDKIWKMFKTPPQSEKRGREIEPEEIDDRVARLEAELNALKLERGRNSEMTEKVHELPATDAYMNKPRAPYTRPRQVSQESQPETPYRSQTSLPSYRARPAMSTTTVSDLDSTSQIPSSRSFSQAPSSVSTAPNSRQPSQTPSENRWNYQQSPSPPSAPRSVHATPPSALSNAPYQHPRDPRELDPTAQGYSCIAVAKAHGGRCRKDWPSSPGDFERAAQRLELMRSTQPGDAFELASLRELAGWLLCESHNGSLGYRRADQTDEVARLWYKEFAPERAQLAANPPPSVVMTTEDVVTPLRQMSGQRYLSPSVSNTSLSTGRSSQASVSTRATTPERTVSSPCPRQLRSAMRDQVAVSAYR